MCLAILLVLPRDADLQQVSHIVGCRAEPLDNASLARALAPTEGVPVRRARGCDCDTGLGAGWGGRGPQDFSSDLKRLKRKRWSQAKIDRWLADKKKSAAVRRRVEHGRTRDGAEGVEAWSRRLRELVGSGVADRVGLFLTDVSSTLEEERVEIRGRRRERVEQASPRTLAELEREILYLFE